MAANSAKKLLRLFLPTTFRSSKRTIYGLASLICEGCGFEISERSPKADTSIVWRMGRNGGCETLSSGLWKALYWPKNGLRSDLIASPERQKLTHSQKCRWLRKTKIGQGPNTLFSTCFIPICWLFLTTVRLLPMVVSLDGYEYNLNSKARSSACAMCRTRLYLATVKVYGLLLLSFATCD